MKSYRQIARTAAVLAAVSLIAAGCSGKGSTPRGLDLSRDYSPVVSPLLGSISESAISGSIRDLCAIPSREVGKAGCLEARDYLMRRFAEYGWKASASAFPTNWGEAYNVIAEWPGSGDGRAVIVSAHYDSWGDGHTGAIDNASGTAGLIAIAKCVSESSARFRRPLRLIAFSSEEYGLKGSKAYAKAADPTKILAVVNMDAIAPHPFDQATLVYHFRYTKEEEPLWLTKTIASVASRYQKETGIRFAPYYDGGPYSYDSRAFEVAGIAAVSILGAGDTPANTPRDTIDKVDASYGAEVARFAAAAAFTLAGPIAPGL